MSLVEQIYKIVTADQCWDISEKDTKIVCSTATLEKVCKLICECKHSCIRCVGIYSIIWCGSDECAEIHDKLAARNADRHEFGKKLVKAGHLCVRYLESYPVQIRWCGKTPCCRTKEECETSSLLL